MSNGDSHAELHSVIKRQQLTIDIISNMVMIQGRDVHEMKKFLEKKPAFQKFQAQLAARLDKDCED
jgi:hypothetical protein